MNFFNRYSTLEYVLITQNVIDIEHTYTSIANGDLCNPALVLHENLLKTQTWKSRRMRRQSARAREEFKLARRAMISACIPAGSAGNDPWCWGLTNGSCGVSHQDGALAQDNHALCSPCRLSFMTACGSAKAFLQR